VDPDIQAAIDASLREYEMVRLPEPQTLLTVRDDSLQGNIVRMPNSFMSSLVSGNCPQPWVISVHNPLNDTSVFVTLDTENCEEGMIIISKEVAMNLGELSEMLTCDLLLGVPKGDSIKFTPQDETFFTHIGVSNDEVLDILNTELSSHRYKVLYKGQIILLNLPLRYGGVREFPILIEDVTPDVGFGIIDINDVDLRLELNDIFTEERQHTEQVIRRVQHRIRDIQARRRADFIHRQMERDRISAERRERIIYLGLPEDATDEQCEEVENAMKISLGLSEDATDQELNEAIERQHQEQQQQQHHNEAREARLRRFER
jgi:hypothetical protein